jgi:ribosome biogenesis GTPase
LLDYLLGKETLLIGQSGVCKSTFINYLFNEQVQKVNQLSEIKNKGKHTTTFVRMFDYKDQFKIIDAPGINEFDIWGLDQRDLKFSFQEFERYQKNCEYTNCTHTHEPNCAVIEAVNNNKILNSRYKNYNNIYKTLE